jgi:hypothetical protein
MPMYKCDKCNKKFKQKNDLRRHKNNKKPCNTFENNTTKFEGKFTCSQCNKIFTRKDNLNRHMISFCTKQIITKFTELKNLEALKVNNDNILSQEKNNENIISDNSNDNTTKKPQKLNKTLLESHNNTKILQCDYCKKFYSRKDSLSRHMTKFCKKRPKENKEQILQRLLEEMYDTIKDIKKENSELKNEIKSLKVGDIINSNNITNNNTQNNSTQINGNINIVAFGKEKLDEIVTDEICKKILFRGFEAVPKLVEYIHFNEKKPEYHNCYIPNLRDKYAIVYDGNNWEVKDAIEVIETLRDNKRDYLERKFDDFYDSLDKETKKKFNRFIDEADTDIVINRYKESLRLLLYNKKNIPLKTRKNMENKKINYQNSKNTLNM